MTEIRSYGQALDFLDRLPRTGTNMFRGEEGLKHSRRFLALAGDPQNFSPVIHIAATSGKGTTAMMLSAILGAHGFKVGLTVSPHVYDIRERVQVNNKLVSKSAFLALVREFAGLLHSAAARNLRPTYYEVLCTMAFTHFRNEQVDYEVVETGLGGRLDTTNTIARADKLAVLGRIGLDHTAILGDSLEAIAREKSGIVGPQNAVIALSQTQLVNAVFQARAKQQTARLTLVDPSLARRLVGDTSKLNKQLLGDYAYEDLSLALAAVRALAARDAWRFDQSTARAALRSLDLPGRFEEVRLGAKEIVFDGAHNPQKIEALLSGLKKKWPRGKYGVVFATVGDKDADRSLDLLAPRASELVLTRIDKQGDLLRHTVNAPLSNRLAPSLSTASYDAVAHHIYSSEQTRWLVTGSFYHLAGVKHALLARDAN